MKQGPELDMDASDIRVVSLAGLVHDLGHGPFSHVFDNEFLPAVLPQNIVSEWDHEKMSADLFDLLLDENHIDLDEDDKKRVESIITSSLHKTSGLTYGSRKGFLNEIVANGRNSVDVDKFDYLMRDCHNCGVKASCDTDRLLTFMKV